MDSWRSDCIPPRTSPASQVPTSMNIVQRFGIVSSSCIPDERTVELLPIRLKCSWLGDVQYALGCTLDVDQYGGYSV